MDRVGAQPFQARSSTLVRAREAVLLLLVLVFSATSATALLSSSVTPLAGVAVVAVLGLVVALVIGSSFRSFILGFVLLRPVLDVFKVLGLDEQGLLPAAAAALLLASGVVWLGAQGHAGARLRLSPLSTSFAVFTAVLVVSAVFSDDIGYSSLEVARVSTAVVLLVVLEQLLGSRTDVQRLLAVVFASAAVPLLVGAYQIATGGYATEADGMGRVTGTFVHPNTFGFYLVMVMLMAVATWRTASRRGRTALALLLLVASAELLLTYSRGSWVVLVVGLLVVGLLLERAILVVLPVALAVVLVAVPSVVVRLRDLTQVQSATGTPGNSLFWRFEQWSASLDLVQGRWLTGIGPGMSDVLLRLPPHNDAVRMYTEGGVLGLLAYLGLLATMVATGIGLLRQTRAGGRARGISVGVTAVFAAFIVDSAGANIINQIAIVSYVVVFAAIGIASARLAREAEDEAALAALTDPYAPVVRSWEA